jgi:hypothetical protein
MAKIQGGVNKARTAAQHNKAISLADTLNRMRSLDDKATITFLYKKLAAPRADGKAPLQNSTLAEYLSSLKLVATRLSKDWSGQPRHALPSYAELVLRPNGPKFLQQYLTDPAEVRRVAISLSSVASRCFPMLEAADRERAVQAWRALLAESRRAYLTARQDHGGYGGYVDPDQLLTADQINRAVEGLPLGSAERCMLFLLQLLVARFPANYQMSAPMLNLGHVKICVAENAPCLEAWAAEACDPDREKWLLLVGEQQVCLVLLFDVTSKGPVFYQYRLSEVPTNEVKEYLWHLPQGASYLFSQVKGSSSGQEKPYAGAVGRDAFNARLNRILAKVFGKVGGTTITQTLLRLSLVRAYKEQLQAPREHQTVGMLR